MKKLLLGELHYEFSRHHEPRLVVKPGESIEVETQDAFSGQIRSDNDRRDKSTQPLSNPQTGPIAVEGAEPGDALAVEIISIDPLIGQCFTRTSDPKQLCEWLGDDCPHGTHACAIHDGQIHWSDSITIPYAPMFGCIGTAPAIGVPSAVPAGPHGGNMDLVEVCPGSTIFLPVFVPGGLLYLGDAHAAMGHGELSASGLEMPSRSVIRLNLVKSAQLPGVRIETANEIMSVATGTPMERSIAEAYARLIQWMESKHDWDRWRAYDLLTHVGQISVGYYGIGTVAAKISKRFL